MTCARGTPLQVGHAVAFSRDGRLLASASHDKSVVVWDVETAQQASACLSAPACVRLVTCIAIARAGRPWSLVCPSRL